MTAVDKLIFSVPFQRTRETEEGISLSQCIGFARENGLMYQQIRLPAENRMATAFFEADTGVHYDGLFLLHSGYSERYVRNLVVNPANFPSYVAMIEVVNRIAAPWLHSCHISRIDFAVDYDDFEFSDFISGIDVADRSHSQVWLDCRSGVPKTLYFGAGKDKIVIYDKGYQLAVQDNFPSPHTVLQENICRIERQLRTASIIRTAFGVTLTSSNLLSALENVRDGRVMPFRGVTTATTGFVQLDETFHDEDWVKRGFLAGLISMGSYANARRYLNTVQSRGFGRYNSYFEREELPGSEQPDAIFRTHLRGYLRGARRRRRTHPVQSDSRMVRAG